MCKSARAIFFYLGLKEVWEYRDLSFLVSFGLHLWMYASQVVYPVSQRPLSGMYIISFHVFLRSASVVSSPMMIGLAPVSSAHMAMSFPGQRSGRNAAVRDGSAYPPRRCGRFSPWAAARRRLCLPASH